MLSRIADSMFWLNRYMERSDGLLRSVKTHYILLLDKDVNRHLSWRPILEIFTNCNEEQLLALQGDSDASMQLLLLDNRNQNSLKTMITKSRENARGMQDHITKEVWEQVNLIYHTLNQTDSNLQLKGFEVMKTIDRLTEESTLYNGVTDTTMSRGMGWNFMRLGKFIERCLLTIEMTDIYFKLIDYRLDDEKDILQWRPLLLSLSGYELHLKTYRSNNHNRNTLHQVLFNEYFTRSVLYNLLRIDKYFKEVIRDNNGKEKENLTKCLGRLVSKVQYTDFESLNELILQEFLSDIRKDLVEFSKQLAQYFFSYS